MNKQEARSEVKITNKGWDHINKGSNSRKRTAKDKSNKFQLLKAAKDIIKNEEKFIEIKQNNQTYFLLSKENKKYIVKVLLKKDRLGRFYFYSVMKH